MSTGNGVSTTNVDQLSAVDELIGNSRTAGADQTGRIPIDALAKQLSASAPFVSLVGLGGTGMTFDTLAEANANLSGIAENSGINIVADSARNGFYVKQSGVLVKKSEATLPALDVRTDNLEGLIASSSPATGAVHVRDKRRFTHDAYFADDHSLRSFNNKLNLNTLNIQDDGSSEIKFKDKRGFVAAVIGEHGFEFAGGGGAPVEPSPQISPIFSGILCGVKGEEQNLYLSSMLRSRSDAPLCQILLSGDSGEVFQGGASIRIEPSRLGPNANVVVRPNNFEGSMRAYVKIPVRSASKRETPAPVISGLAIGNSIVNRSLLSHISDFLTAWGYPVNWLGTLATSNVDDNALDASGPMGEAREGWRLTNYTWEVIRGEAVAAGGEAGYLSATKTIKKERNPFIRPATSGDPSGIVKNGYVLDFDNYLSRFSVSTPNFILNGLGRNDIRFGSVETLYNQIFAAEMLLMDRLRSVESLATTPVIRFLPGTAISPDDAPDWPRYLEFIRALQAVQSARSDSNYHLVPTWAMHNPEDGYPLQGNTPDPVSRVLLTGISDPVHPYGSSRLELAKSIATTIACLSAGTL